MSVAGTGGWRKPARGFRDVSVTVPVGTQALPLWVVADDEGGLSGIHAESDETNNALNSRLFLTATPNEAPVVDAGEDRVVTIAGTTLTVALNGIANDDDLPIGVLNTVWGQVSGPAAVTFAEPTNPLTLVTFTEPRQVRAALTLSSRFTRGGGFRGGGGRFGGGGASGRW